MTGAAVKVGERLLRLRDLEEKTGLGRTTIYKYIGEGRFPNSFHLGHGTVRWKESEIDAWIAALASNSGAPN